MMKQLTQPLKVSSLAVVVLLAAITLEPGLALAWTSARLTDVAVTVELAEQGPSRVETRARFAVSGGRFHGFDLASLPGGRLVEEESQAVLDDGRIYPLAFRSVRGDKTRVVLAGGVEVEKGGVNFKFVHKIDFVEEGALRRYEGRARFNWTPLIWDESLDVMKVNVVLPGRSGSSPLSVDRAVTANYEVALIDNGVEMTKFRPVRWYPMQVIVDFDSALISGLGQVETEKEEPDRAAMAAVGSFSKPIMPRHIEFLPFAVALIGLLALVVKALHVRRVYSNTGIEARFSLLPATSVRLRILLTLGALALGLFAQRAGSLAAGVPPFAVAAALWMSRREKSLFRIRSGGAWREMSDEDMTGWARLLKAYRRSRRSMFDITTPCGMLAFSAVLLGLGYVVSITHENWSTVGWASIINGLILVIPAWFSSVRAELPIDPTLEGFAVLKKRRRALKRLIDADKSGTQVRFWVREDEQGPVEVRLRAENLKSGLNGIEAAGEVVLSGSMHRVRTAIVLRMEPGGETAKLISGCPHVSEHHLTPDLQEEIVVLRSRRGRNPGLTPLRTALAMLPG